MNLNVKLGVSFIYCLMLDFFRAIPKKRTVKIKLKSGIIYYSPGLFKKTVFYAGTNLFVIAFLYLLYLYYPLVKASFKFNYTRILGNYDVSLPSSLDQKEVFILHIPKILAKSEIVPDVDPFDKAQYLKVLNSDKVALAKGSALPGLGKTSYIFAHSTQQGVVAVRNNAVFYLLGELVKGDVLFISRGDYVYKYKVTEKKIIRADEIKYLEYQAPRETVILQTCWPIGTDWKRLLVFAEKI